MKSKLWMLAMVLALAAVAHAATNDLTGLLQQGLFEEEANRNLDAAISDYQSLASDFDKDRQLAATAIFRLGECYRKLGKTNEAVIQYQRIVKEFSDQQTLATLSGQNLAGLNAAPKEENNNVWDTALLEARANVALRQGQIQKIEKMSHDEQRVFVQQNYPNSVLTEAMTQLVNAERDLIKLKTDYAPDHPKYKTAQELVDDLNAKIDAQTDAVIQGLPDKLATAQAKLAFLQNGKSEWLTAYGSSTAKESTTTTDDEQQEIRDIQAMIQNSPDLINAVSVGSGGMTPLMLAAEKGQLLVAKYLLDHGANVNETGGNSISGQPLFLAAAFGHKAMVELLLAHGADVNSGGNNHGLNPLYCAASKGFTEVAEVLLAHKADPNLKSENGMRALHAAVTGGKTDLFQPLIDAGADVNAADNSGNSPLHIAANENKPAAARILIASKADVNARDKEGNTPLHDAAGAGTAKIMSLLLDSGANVDATNHVDITPLSFAVANGRVDAARALLEHKADPNHSGPTPSGSWPSHSYSIPSQPLVYAAIAGGRNEILKLLLDAGANPEADTASGYSPLYAAINYNNVDAVQLLLQHGANPNVTGQATESPLNAAFSGGDDVRAARMRIVPLLLDKGADPNARSHDGLVPLMRTSDPEVARWLIEHKADVNAKLSTGRTPLMRMSAYGTNYLKFLLENGAKPDLQDTNGNTALHFAIYNEESPDFIAVLLAHKANPNIQNSDGNTPLDVAKARISEPVRFPRPNNSRTLSAEDAQKVVEMLMQAGGMANLPRRDRIAIRRGSAVDYSIFSKGPHDWNRFNLMELIATDYGLISTVRSGDWSPRSNWADQALPFPDFKKVVIYRRGTDPAKQTATEVDVEKTLADGDCSRDVWLDWGDVVEIPEADHPVDEEWQGLSNSVVNALTNCVSRQVTVKIKGESTVLTLAPEGRVDNPSFPGRVESFRNRISMFPGASSSRPSFMLRSVLDNSRLIRVSSDLSHVKVTRHDPVTKKNVEWLVDCTDPNRTDLWLRDGDVIEVPEK